MTRRRKLSLLTFWGLATLGCIAFVLGIEAWPTRWTHVVLLCGLAFVWLPGVSWLAHRIEHGCKRKST